MAPAASPWTPEQMQTLITMHPTSSMGSIANAVGKSRNAVAGQITKLRRKGLLPPTEIRIQKRIRVKLVDVPSIPKVQPLPPNIIFLVPTEKRRIRLKLVETDTAVKLVELESHHCRWPLGDPKLSDFRFCGCKRVLTTRPYCAEHIRKAGRMYESSPRRA